MATSGELTVTISKALGVPFETVREHLRNIRRTPNTITFSGYGRSAAAMTPRDAVRLLLAVAGSQVFVKNSKVTLDGFRRLQPIKYVRRPVEAGERPPTLEDHLVRLMERLIAGRDDLPSVYVRDARRPKHAALALTLMSAATIGTRDPPRVAIARHYTDEGSGALSFATSPAGPRQSSPRWNTHWPSQKPGWSIRDMSPHGRSRKLRYRYYNARERALPAAPTNGLR